MRSIFRPDISLPAPICFTPAAPERRKARKAVESAESRLDEAVKLNPDFEQAILLLAEPPDQERRPCSPPLSARALDPQKRPQTAQAHYLLATAYLEQQKTADALAVFRQMTELFPTDPQPSYLEGAILLAQGQLSDARKALERSTEIGPDDRPPIEKLVDLDVAEKQYGTALARADKQIEHTPGWRKPGAFEARFISHNGSSPTPSRTCRKLQLDPNSTRHTCRSLRSPSLRTGKRRRSQSSTLPSRRTRLPPPSRTDATRLDIGQLYQKNFAAARDTYEKFNLRRAQFPHWLSIISRFCTPNIW